MRTAPRGADGALPAPMISAHRGGAEIAAAGTWAAYQGALAQRADYLEFDARRTSDGTLIAYHHARVLLGRPVASMTYPELCRAAGFEVPTTAALLRLLADRAGAHIDLKDPGAAPAVVTQALDLLPPARVIATTRDRPTATALKRAHPDVPVGLTIGGDLADSARHALRTPRHRGRATRRAGWVAEVESARVDWVAVHSRLAETGVLTECRARGIRTMVWTVNGASELRSWLSNRDVDVLVTDQPGRAVALRQSR
jgi:glycerophosphoryl diester phosphodiesterase